MTDSVSPPRAATIVRSLAADVAPPLVAYYGLHVLGISDYRALLAGTVVAGIRVGFVAFRRRRLDPFSGFLLVVFGVGLAMAFVTGDAKFLLVKDSIGTGVAGLIFLGSCFLGKPLIFHAAQRMSARSAAAAAQWNGRWETQAGFRRVFTTMTLVWGVGLLIEAAVRIPLIYLLPVDVMVGLSTLMWIVAFVALMTWNVWYGKRMQRRGEEYAGPRPSLRRTSVLRPKFIAEELSVCW